MNILCVCIASEGRILHGRRFCRRREEGKCENLRPHIRCTLKGVGKAKHIWSLFRSLISWFSSVWLWSHRVGWKREGKREISIAEMIKILLNDMIPRMMNYRQKMGLKWRDYIVFTHNIMPRYYFIAFASSRTQKASSVIYCESQKFDALPQSCSRQHAQIYKLIKQAVTLAKCTLSWTLSCYGKLFAWLRSGFLLPENQELNETWMKFIRLVKWISSFWG